MSYSFYVATRNEPSAAHMKGWFSYSLFRGMKCFRRQEDEQNHATYFYPEPCELRQRLATLEADPSPVLRDAKKWFCLPEEQSIDVSKGIPFYLESMRKLVDCYEKEVINKTAWETMAALLHQYPRRGNSGETGYTGRGADS